MAQELSGKIAVVTGGAAGLGRAMVELFVKEGAKVVIADVEVERGEQLAAALGAATRFKRTDVSDAEQVQAVIDFAVAEFGGLNVMVNNAGVSQKIFPRFVDDTLEDFQRVININLYGVMAGSQRAARYMKNHGGGVIINVASVAGTKAGFGITIYRASKAAVIHFTKCIAVDFAEYGIRVNCLSPGNIQTEMSAFPIPGMSQEQVESINKAMLPIRQAGQPLKRQGRPIDVANAALYLASDLSAQVTGQELVVDGGATAGDPVNHFEAVIAARAKILQEVS